MNIQYRDERREFAHILTAPRFCLRVWMRDTVITISQARVEADCVVLSGYLGVNRINLCTDAETCLDCIVEREMADLCPEVKFGESGQVRDVLNDLRAYSYPCGNRLALGRKFNHIIPMAVANHNGGIGKWRF
jgi:hypothetical protein